MDIVEFCLKSIRLGRRPEWNVCQESTVSQFRASPLVSDVNKPVNGAVKWHGAWTPKGVCFQHEHIISVIASLSEPLQLDLDAGWCLPKFSAQLRLNFPKCSKYETPSNLSSRKHFIVRVCDICREVSLCCCWHVSAQFFLEASAILTHTYVGWHGGAAVESLPYSAWITRDPGSIPTTGGVSLETYRFVD